MAQYRATIQGMRGEVSRLGTKSSGIHANVDAWDIGVYVSIRYDIALGTDVCTVYLTGGSNGGNHTHIGTYKVINGAPRCM